MNWKRKGKELAGKNRREMAVGSYRERNVETTGNERGGSWLPRVENGREGAGTERGEVEKVRQNENSLKREV